MTTGSPPLAGPTAGVDPTAKFLLDAWPTLLEPECPEAFRSRYCDLPALLFELDDVAGRAMQGDQWVKHVEVIRSELEFFCENYEKTWLVSKPSLHYWLATAIKAVNPKDHGWLAEIRRLATLGLKAFGDPNETWAADLRRLIAQTPPDHSALYNRLGTIASQLERQNIDRDRLLAAAEAAPDNLTSAEAAANAILCAATSDEQQYTCYLKVREYTPGDVFSLIKNTDIRIISANQLAAEGLAGDIIASGNEVVVAIPISGRGFRLAAAAAYRQFSWHADILNFYSHHSALEIEEVTLVVDTNGTKQLVGLGDSHNRRPRKARRNLARNTTESPHTEVNNGRIRAALEQYSIAVRARDTRVALSTIWTGLETLLGHHGPKAIHDRVIHWVAPIFAWRSFASTLTYMAIRLHEIGVGGPGVPMAPGLSHSTPRFVSIEDMAVLACGADTNPLVTQMLSITAPYPLLNFQYRKLREQMRSPAVLSGYLENVRKSVEWTIMRVYRARNLTVHYGLRSALEARLYEHLHEYFSVILSTLLAALRENPSWDAEVAMESARQRYFQALYMMRKQTNLVCLADLSNHASRVPLWPTSAPQGATAAVALGVPQVPPAAPTAQAT